MHLSVFLIFCFCIVANEHFISFSPNQISLPLLIMISCVCLVVCERTVSQIYPPVWNKRRGSKSRPQAPSIVSSSLGHCFLVGKHFRWPSGCSGHWRPAGSHKGCLPVFVTQLFNLHCLNVLLLILRVYVAVFFSSVALFDEVNLDALYFWTTARPEFDHCVIHSNSC